MDEDKRLEDIQEPTSDGTEGSQAMENEMTPGAGESTQPDANSELNQGSASSDVPAVDELVVEDAEAVEEGGINYRAAIDEMTRTIQQLKSQLEERSTQYMRIVADFDNFRKRTQKEKEDLEQQVKCNTVVELLPVVDNFERARSQIKPQTDAEMTIHKSYQGVYKDFVDRLKKIGVAPMRSEGKEFDPIMHEAVIRQPTDEYPEGTVMEELVRGYLLGERVLRHAMVKVAATPEPMIPSDEVRSGGDEV
ncbi:MAG: nucleotide exchange factor GrpE [Leptolyngbyaceae cyanobacterium SL_7_1]|nr:nucleotide exchange factor GrpE [Leptolyngbyaceae cyanobacterium SL_7_1]